MKKLTALVLLVFLALSFAACAAEKKDDDKMRYSGELFGPVDIADGVEKVYVGIDTGFINIFKESDKENPFQSFTTNGFDDVENSLKTIRAVDANFDGYGDLIIPFRRVDDYQYYYVYLWNNEMESFSLVPSMSDIGNIEVRDGYIEGVSSEHGAYFETKYYWVDGTLETEEEFDEAAATARKCAEGLLGKEVFSVSFARDELVDMTLSKLYFIEEGGEVTAYIAVSYDTLRAFYSPASDVYFEIERDGDVYKKGQSYSKLAFDGVPVGYSPEEYLKLDASQKDYYGMIGDKLAAYEKVYFESADAAEAMKAYFKDHPVWYLCFVPDIGQNLAAGQYCYTWDYYDMAVTKEVLSEKMREYSEKISAVVNEMPTGLESIEKYVYLAEKLQYVSHEEHHHGKDEDGLGIYIPGDSLNEKAAKTYAYMCEKAELYCTWDGEQNTIMDRDEKRTVSVYDAFAFSAGSDEWLDAFFMGDNK